MLGVDAEARAARPPSAGWSGTEHLDAFADVVADYAAARPGATVSGSARLPGRRDGRGERAGARPKITVAHDRVQILTVHAAKGLEWQVVAVPHLSGRVFPVDGVDADVAHRRGRPAAAAARRPRHPRRTRRPGARHVRRERSETVVGQDLRAQAQPRPAPRRRGTQAAVRGAHPGGGHPAAVRSPLGRVGGQAARAVGVPAASSRRSSTARPSTGEPCGVVEHWAPAPADGDPNPLRDKVVEAVWPADPAGARRGDVDRGAALVRQRDDGRTRRAGRRRRRLGRRRRRPARRAGPGAAGNGPRRCPRRCR